MSVYLSIYLSFIKGFVCVQVLTNLKEGCLAEGTLQQSSDQRKHIYVQRGWLPRLTRLDPCCCKNVYPSVIRALRFDTDSASEWSPIDARSVNFDFDRGDVMSAIIAEISPQIWLTGYLTEKDIHHESRILGRNRIASTETSVNASFRAAGRCCGPACFNVKPRRTRNWMT